MYAIPPRCEGITQRMLTLHAQVSAAEMKEVVTAYKDKSDVKQVQSSGLHVAGERFVVIKADERSLYGKKVYNHPRPRHLGSKS